MSKTRNAIYISIILLVLAGAILQHFQGTLFFSFLSRVPGIGPFLSSSSIYPDGSSETDTVLGSTTATTTAETPHLIVDNSITTAEIIALTNQARSRADLPPVTENFQLDAAAEAKLNDMFSQQYFAHVSPRGVGPADVVARSGYAYVVEGENLAEGDFKNPEDVIAAWMASPGHRANILNTRFRDIGVAVGKGVYEGEEVWMAVQEFAKPLSACPVIDNDLHEAIVANQAKTAKLSQELDSIKKMLTAAATGTPNENASYNQIANRYNTDVTLYNDVVNRLKAEISVYNQQVEAFNACVNG